MTHYILLFFRDQRLTSPRISGASAAFAPSLIPVEDQTISSPFIGSTATLGAPRVLVSQDVKPPLINYLNGLLPPRLTIEPIALTCPLIGSSTQTFQPAVTTSISVPLLSSGSIGTVVVLPGQVTVTQSTVSSTATLFSPAINPGQLSLGSPPIASTAALRNPSITVGSVAIGVVPITSLAQPIPPQVVVQVLNLGLPAIQSTVTLSTQVVTASSFAVRVPLLVSGSLYLPTITPQAVSITASHIASVSGCIPFVVVPGSAQLQVQQIASSSVLRSPSLATGSAQLSTPLITSGQVFSPTVAPQSILVSVTRITTSATLFVPVVANVLNVPTTQGSSALYGPRLERQPISNGFVSLDAFVAVVALHLDGASIKMTSEISSVDLQMGGASSSISDVRSPVASLSFASEVKP